ncbi:Origin recognition complex subunit 3 [Elasticomyces elasticus]|nr:Origin recognition complex subunit 3 [Elasticomyces elasticus]
MSDRQYEACYTFEAKGTPQGTKRKRADPVGLHASWKRRRTLFEQVWSSQKQKIEEVLSTINASTLRDLLNYLNARPEGARRNRLPTGLVLSGSASATYGSVFARLSSLVASFPDKIYIPVKAATATNLKGFLKCLITSATNNDSSNADGSDDEKSGLGRKGPRLLNYDLQNLSEYVQKNGINQVVVVFQDSEAFDTNLLAEVIKIFGCWIDRIPFVCLFGIATSIDNLQQRLPRAAVRCLDGQLFNTVRADEVLEQVFRAAHSFDTQLWFGSGLWNTMLERQRNHLGGIDAFTDALLYASMSHFFANSLTLFLSEGLSFKDVPNDHFEAVRNLGSFQTHVRRLLDSGKAQLVHSLLHSNTSLFDYSMKQLTSERHRMRSLTQCAVIIHTLRSRLAITPATSYSAIQCGALAGTLRDSPLLRILMATIKRCPSNVLEDLLAHVQPLVPDSQAVDFSAIVDDIQTLRKADISGAPFRSTLDTPSMALHTTMMAQKVTLSKSKPAILPRDAAYSDIVQRFHDLLAGHFTQTLIDPRSLFLNEVFFYDLKSPYREVFMPKPRAAIERALSNPADYLGCSCCGASGQSSDGKENDDVTLAPSHPSTAIMYQLYVQSGALINVADLWSAFNAVSSGGEDMDEDGERMNMALFQRALAELRYMGLIKPTRKKADCVAKVLWKGL